MTLMDYLPHLIVFALEHGESIVDAFVNADPAKRPKEVPVQILSRVVAADAAKIAIVEPPAISQDSEGLWSVEGLPMSFLSRKDAVIAADVLVRARATDT